MVMGGRHFESVKRKLHQFKNWRTDGRITQEFRVLECVDFCDRLHLELEDRSVQLVDVAVDGFERYTERIKAKDFDCCGLLLEVLVEFYRVIARCSKSSQPVSLVESELANLFNLTRNLNCSILKTQLRKCDLEFQFLFELSTSPETHEFFKQLVEPTLYSRSSNALVSRLYYSYRWIDFPSAWRMIRRNPPVLYMSAKHIICPDFDGVEAAWDKMCDRNELQSILIDVDLSAFSETEVEMIKSLVDRINF